MWNIRRIYNQNRKSVWLIVVIIFFLFFLLKLVNYWVGINQEKKAENNKNISSSDYNISNNSIIQSNKSVTSGEEIPKEDFDKANEIIGNFFNYCNAKKYEEAYNLLTDECKEEMYNSLDDFKEFYCKEVFKGGTKNVSAENWTNNIYKVKISDDYLSTGKYTDENTIQDYITVEKDKNDSYKLNINEYIGRSKINKESENEKINIKVIEENKYINYLSYTFEITNNSYRTIMLDTLKNTNTMYLEDNNKMKSTSYSHELSDSQMIIKSGEKKRMKIKYYSEFSSGKEINKIVFSRIMLDYDRYVNMKNNASYNEYYTFEINI